MSRRIWLLTTSTFLPLLFVSVLIGLLSTKIEAASIPADSASIQASSSSKNSVLAQNCSYQSRVLADAPIAYWRLGETSGLTAVNIGSLGPAVSGTYAHGVTLDVTGLVPRDTDPAAEFDGVDDYVDIPSNAAINTSGPYTARSIELWFKADAMSGTQVLFEEGGNLTGLNLFLDDDELNVGAFAAGTGVWVTNTVTTNTNYHVAVVYDGTGVTSTVTGYLNGISFGSATTSTFGEIPTHFGLIAIGAIHNDTTYPSGPISILEGDHFDGVIDDVALYNAVLTPTQIQLHAAGCAISTTSSITLDTPDPSVIGQPVMVTFTVTSTLSGSGSPTGNVTVTVSGGTESCVGSLSAGLGSCMITLNSTGSRTLTATYGGDGDFTGSSDTASHTVNQAGTVTTITLDTPDPSVVGQPVTVTFSVAAMPPGGGTPTGNVTITISGGSESCVGTLSGGSGSCLITLSATGSRTLTANYGGDANFTSSSGTAPHTVNQAGTATTITLDTPDPSVIGQPVTVTFSVAAAPPGSGTPTGNVTVTVSSGPQSCTDTLVAGSGSCLITLDVIGSPIITATYGGDTNFTGSIDTTSHTVNQAGTVTTITLDTPDPSVVGQPVTVTFSVAAAPPASGTPTGNVMVTVSGGSESCVGPLSGGTGSCLITLNATGSRTLIATYGGDATFTGSIDTAPHTVNRAGTATAIILDTPDPSIVGQPVTMTFLVAATPPGSGTPTGIVTITVSGGSESCVDTLSSGLGSCQITLNAAGSRTLTATYGGDAFFTGSVDTALHTVNRADTATAITLDAPDPSVVGQSVTVTFSVTVAAPGSGSPTGNVTVTVSGGSESCVGTLSGGSGSCLITLNTTGSRTLIASYGGGADFNGSSDTEQHTVNNMLLYLPLIQKP